MEQKQFDELKNSLETTAKEIDSKVSAMNAKAEAGETIGKENTGEIKKLVQQHAEQQKHIDDLAAEFARTKGQGFMQEQKMPSDLIAEALESNNDFKALRTNGKGRATLKLDNLKVNDLNQKATMLTPGVAPGTVIMPQYIGGIINQPLRRTTLLDLIPVSPTTSNAITYMRESAYNSNAAYVAEGQLKPEDDLSLAQVTAPVQTLATTMRISKQLLDDLPALVGYIAARAPQKMRLVKELACIYGSGTGGQLQGIAPIATPFAADATLILPTPNNYDVLGAAILQAQVAEYFPTGIVIHPVDEFLMLHAKDSQGRYLFPEMREGMIGGVPYATSTLAQLKGNFLVGDYALGSQLFQRQGLEIEMFDQDRDNVVRNLITIRVEERHALAVYRPDAFVYGNFATAKTDLTA
jgi:HK97 family phage major capsid protein